MHTSEAPSLCLSLISASLCHGIQQLQQQQNRITVFFDQQLCSLLWEFFILRQQFECARVENRRECGTQFWSYPSFMNYGYMLCFFPKLKKVFHIFYSILFIFLWQEDKPDIQQSAVARTGCVYKSLSQTLTLKGMKDVFSNSSLFFFSSTPHFSLSNSCSNCKRHSKILNTWNSTKRDCQ